MTAGIIGLPFQGEVFYWIETAYDPTADYPHDLSTATHRISDAVNDARIDTGDINTTLFTISEPTLADFSMTMQDPTLHLEWVEQPNATGSLASLCCDRTSLGTLQSMTFMVIVNKKQTGTSSASYYQCNSCVCKTWNKTGSRGGNFICTADFSVATVTANTLSSTTTYNPGAIGKPYATFNKGGAITWAGVTAAWITDSMNVTVDNNLQDLYTIGSTTKIGAIPGAKTVTGSCDISLDSGGGVHFGEVISATNIDTLGFNTGCTDGSHGSLWLSHGRFDSTSIDVNQSGEGMMTSVPFTFRELSWVTGA